MTHLYVLADRESALRQISLIPTALWLILLSRAFFRTAKATTSGSRYGRR